MPRQEPDEDDSTVVGKKYLRLPHCVDSREKNIGSLLVPIPRL
jgi:hypothetical protein